MPSPAALSLADAPPFQIGSLDVRPAAREIAVQDRRVGLEPRTMQVLVMLGRRPGEVVSRQALIDGGWGGRVVGEDAVNRALLKLRRSLREVGAVDLTVETVPRVGYRLVTAPGASAPPAPAAGQGRRWLLAGLAGVALAGGAAAWVARRRPAPRSAAAQELYVRGEAAFQQGTPEGNAEAVSYFRRLIAIDGKDAQGWAALALGLRFEQSYVLPGQLSQAEERADDALRQAMALDADQPDAIAAQALYIPFRGHWLETERRLVQGLRRVPRSGVLNTFYGKLLAAVGRTDAACGRFRTGLVAEPFVPLLRADYAGALWSVGRVPEADRVLDEADALWPRYVELWQLRFWLYALTGRTLEAAALLAKGAPPEVKVAALRALQLAIPALEGGSPTLIAGAVAATREAVQQGAMAAADAAGLAAVAGDADAAFAFARSALGALLTGEVRRAVQPTFLFRPPMARLHADARYGALLRDIGLDGYWAKSGTSPDPRYRTPALASAGSN